LDPNSLLSSLFSIPKFIFIRINLPSTKQIPVMRYFFLLILCFTFSNGFTQNNILVIGFVRDSISQEAIPYTSITNMNIKKTVLTNNNGQFKINVIENQLLSFASVGYNFDTLRLTKKVLQNDTLYVFLSPLIRNLQGVIVSSRVKYSAYQLDSLQRRKDFFQTMSDHTIPVTSVANSGAGIGFNLDHFYNREKRKRKVINLFDQMEQEQYINYRFTPLLVSKYATLSDDYLSLFIQQYRPTYIWLRKNVKQEDVLYYINEKLKLFLKEQ